MKKIIVAILSVVLILVVFLSSKNNTAYAEEIVDYHKVTHFFTHALIAYPELAFQKDNNMRVSYERDCITVDEFKKFLQVIYENDYVLIDIDEIYEVKNGKAVKKKFKFPKNKKACIISFDDINYYRNKMNKGMNDKIVVNNGKIATYTENTAIKYNYNNECITILANFINDKKEFSYNGAKGIINLTGFDGILGYRTQVGAIDRDSEIKKAKEVVNQLKSDGWKFACHSYGHYHMKNISTEKFIADTNKWINEVEPIIGKTNLYVYPYGEWEIGDENKSPKHDYLEKNGFSFFFGVGSQAYFGNVPFCKTNFDKPLFMDRIAIDGQSLKYNKEVYKEYFDTEKVYCR